MSPRFLITLKKWPIAVQQAFSYLNEDSTYGEIVPIAFRFGPPSRGRLPLTMRIDGRMALRCEISDTNLSFLQDMREWLERSLKRDREGKHFPELLTIDCADMVLSLVIVHAGWDLPPRKDPTSFFVIIRSDMDAPAAYCFSYTLDIIGGMYEALLECIERYRSSFDNPSVWYDVKRFDKLNPVPTSERLMEEIRSEKLDIIRKILYKK